MDIRMPVMDGYEATLRLRGGRHNPNQQVPIIALTASALVDEREKALAVGMDYHLPKPFSANQLAEVMKSFGLKQLESQPAIFTFSEQLDSNYLDILYGKDIERATAMFETFDIVIGQEIEKLQKLLSQKDFTGFKKAAHKIKPNFSMVGLTEFTKVMEAFENHDFGQGHTQAMETLHANFLTDFVEKNKVVNQELHRLKTFLASTSWGRSVTLNQTNMRVL